MDELFYIKTGKMNHQPGTNNNQGETKDNSNSGTNEEPGPISPNRKHAANNCWVVFYQVIIAKQFNNS